MEILSIKPTDKFLLETDGTISIRELEHLLYQWEKLFPNNELVIIKKGTVKLVRFEPSEQ